MKKFKEKLLLRPSRREANNANEDFDLSTSSTRVRGSTYSGSTLTRGQSKEESGPWGLKELYPGRDPIVE